MRRQEMVRIVRYLKKNQENLEKRLDKIETPTITDKADAVSTEKTWLKKFVEDTDMDALNSVATAGSTLVGGIGLTHYVLNKNLTEEQRRELIEKTRTDYVTIEHLDNNMLMTDYYQKSDQINLFHTEKTTKPWYKFW
jgi:hypothetical protein